MGSARRERPRGQMIRSYRHGEEAEQAASLLAEWGIGSRVLHGLEIAGARAYEAAIGRSAFGGALAGALAGFALTPFAADPYATSMLPAYAGVLGGIALGTLSGLLAWPLRVCRRCFPDPADRFGVFVDDAVAERAARLLGSNP